nr:glycosyltransferase family 2 protein [Bacillus subtilis]
MVNLYYPKDRLEIIVVNDNSSDRTGDIVNEFSEKYDFIKMVITKPPNAGKGKSSALNSGFAESNGDVICVYDADNTPEKMVVCITSCSVPDE